MNEGTPPISSTQTAPASETRSDAPLPKRRGHLWRGVGILVVVLLVALVALGYAIAPRPPVVSLEGADPAVVESVHSAQARARWLPWLASSWGRLGMVLYVHDFNAQADECFDRAQRLSPRDPEWPYLRARSIESADPDAALPLLQQAADLCANDPAAPPAVRLRLGEALVEHGRIDEAEKQFQLELQRNPNDPRALLGMGRVDLARNRIAEARLALEKSISLDPEHRSAHMLLATVLGAQNDTEGAARERRLAAAMPEQGKWPDRFLQDAYQMRTGELYEAKMAQEMADRGDLDRAQAMIETTLAKYPRSGITHDVLGRILVRRRDFAGAEKAFTEATRLSPKSVSNWVDLGNALFQDEKYADAETNFREALRLKPDLAEGHYDVGMCRLRQEDFTGALDSFRQAVRRRPDLAAGYTAMGQALMALGREKEAVEPLQTALKLSPYDGDALALLDRARQRLAPGK